MRTDLVLADQRLRTSSIAAAQAAEAFNTARWQLSLARRAAREADLAQQAALAAVDRQRAAYESTLASTYQMSPELTALSAIVRSDGIATVVDRATTLTNAEQAMDERYDDFRAASTVADVVAAQATEARATAEDLREQTRASKDAARAAEAAAADEAAAIAAERDTLIGELADLQGVSVGLAAERQAELERRAEERRKRAEERKRKREHQDDPPTPPPAPGRAHADPDASPDAGPAEAAEDSHFADPDPRARTDADARADPDPDPDAGARAGPDAHPGAGARPRPHPGPGAVRRRGGGGRLRCRSARRRLPVGRRRPGLMGLLGPDDDGLAGGRDLAPALLGGPVRRLHADRRRGPPARGPGLLGREPVGHLPRRDVRRRGRDHPRAPHRPAGQPRVDVLLDGTGLLRPSLTAALGDPRLWNAPPPLDATEASSVA